MKKTIFWYLIDKDEMLYEYFKEMKSSLQADSLYILKTYLKNPFWLKEERYDNGVSDFSFYLYKEGQYPDIEISCPDRICSLDNELGSFLDKKTTSISSSPKWIRSKYRIMNKEWMRLDGEIISFSDNKDDDMENSTKWYLVNKNEMLKRFEQEVQNKHYNKIDYADWRKFRDGSGQMWIAEWRSSLTGLLVYDFFYTQDKHITLKKIPSEHDNSLGGFLFEHLTLICDASKYESWINEIYEDPNDKGLKDFSNWKNLFRRYADGSYHSNFMPLMSLNDDNTCIYTITIPEEEAQAVSINTFVEKSGWESVEDIVNKTVSDAMNNFNQATKDIDLQTATNEAVNNFNQAIKAVDLQTTINGAINNFNNKGKKNTMSNLVNFDFGPVSGTQFRMSPYGIAVRTASNGWVAYNANSGDMMDVEILNFDVSKFLYKMPTVFDQVNVGDIIFHSGVPYFVKEKNADGTIRAIDYSKSIVVDVLPVKSPFGFNFFTKVVSLVDFNQVGADAANPFGNILPFMLLANEGQNGNMSDALPWLLMMSGNSANANINPMMFYFLLHKEGKDTDILPFLLMSGSNPFNLQGMNMSGAAPANG